MLLLAIAAVGLLAAAVTIHTLAHSPAAPWLQQGLKDIAMTVSANTQAAIDAYKARQAANTDAATIADLKAQLDQAKRQLVDNEAAWEAATAAPPSPAGADPASPVAAALSTDPAHGATPAGPVIITQHPDGTVLATPVVGGVLASAVTVDPGTGTPTAGPDVALGPTVPAPAGTPTPAEAVAAGSATAVAAPAG